MAVSYADFLASKLKESYWRQQVRNLRALEDELSAPSLFDIGDAS